MGTIADMLFLAKADNNLLIPLREEVDLRAEVSSLLEYYEAYADEKQLQLSYSGEAAIAGDRLMLRRAIGNLLSNVGSSRVDLQACKLEYSIVSPK